MGTENTQRLPEEGLTFESGFHEVMGHRVVHWERGHAELELEVLPKHLNRSGVIHGGVLSTLIDAVCGFAGVDPDDRRGVITLSLSVNFLGQVSDGRLRVVGKRRGGGNRIYFATGEVFDHAGELIAMGEGSFRLRSKPTLDGGASGS
ncbi:MAG: PaaI family thioesterase [Ectothiorhodospiraceae bacterium]|nr:PaaI family thioesterase [Ectothiorhodospiraceae bacterium]MCH8504255.1 PaaI family thioesterase [Ectothiorhodospiraceae bacterium]